MRSTKLTPRQAAVLAAVERLGRPVMADLWEQFPSLQPSAIRRVLGSLESKGLIAHAGDDSQAYLNGVTWWSTAFGPTEPDPGVSAIEEAIERSALGLEASVDAHGGHVDVFLPLVELEAYLQGLPSAPLDRLRALSQELAEVGTPCRVDIGTAVSANPEPRLAIRLVPEERA
jgi:hypothetical protein